SPTITVVNGYGPTESTTFACCNRIEPGAACGSPVPIGKPVSNSTVYILGPHLQPVPSQVPGELFIGGDGFLAWYWNRPALTAEKLVPNPFSVGPGSRLYSTGDVGRFVRDGNIEFLGRRDNQVKIRGFRVELEEVESTLASHPAVSDCAVIADGADA